MNNSASVRLLRHANACFREFFRQFSGGPMPGGDEELRALLQLHEVLQSIDALLDGRLQSATDRDVREALGCYRENLIRLRRELSVMEGSAIARRVCLDSRREHLYAAKAWCAASRAIS